VIVAEQVFAGKEATSRGTAATAEMKLAAAAATAPQMTPDRVSPVLSALSDLMRTRQTLQTAIALQEIFGPPRCRRPHHQGRGRRTTGLQ
jgi:acyl-CoA reductase-like NAD-dependent aldehyde dehydrogenase